MSKILDLDLEKSLEMNIEVINELIVQNETICNNQLISDTIKNSTLSSNKPNKIKKISSSLSKMKDSLYQ